MKLRRLLILIIILILILFLLFSLVTYLSLTLRGWAAGYINGIEFSSDLRRGPNPWLTVWLFFFSFTSRNRFPAGLRGERGTGRGGKNGIGSLKFYFINYYSLDFFFISAMRGCYFTLISFDFIFWVVTWFSGSPVLEFLNRFLGALSTGFCLILIVCYHVTRR